MPGRSSITRLSAVLASQAPSGWKPYPDLNVGAAPSLSLRALISVPSSPRQRGPQGGGQPGLVGQLAQQYCPGVPDQALALAGHRQPVIPPRIIHDEERSCLGDQMAW